jgi:hypothetical protein
MLILHGTTIIHQPFSAHGIAVQPRHAAVHARLVKEDQPARVYALYALPPFRTLPLDIFPELVFRE